MYTFSSMKACFWVWVLHLPLNTSGNCSHQELNTVLSSGVILTYMSTNFDEASLNKNYTMISSNSSERKMISACRNTHKHFFYELRKIWIHQQKFCCVAPPLLPKISIWKKFLSLFVRNISCYNLAVQFVLHY